MIFNKPFKKRFLVCHHSLVIFRRTDKLFGYGWFIVSKRTFVNVSKHFANVRLFLHALTNTILYRRNCIKECHSTFNRTHHDDSYDDFIILQRRPVHRDFYNFEKYTYLRCSKTRPFLNTALVGLKRIFFHAFHVIKPCTVFYVH